MTEEETIKKFDEVVGRLENTKLDDVITRLVRIETKLDTDYRTLYGNGHPGLVEKHGSLENRVNTLEVENKTKNGLGAHLLAFFGWIVTTAIALYAAIKNTL